MNERTFGNFLKLGAIASSVLSLSSCCVPELEPLDLRVKNESSTYFGIVYKVWMLGGMDYYWTNVMINEGEEDRTLHKLTHWGGIQGDFDFSLVTLDSVIDVRLVFHPGVEGGEPPFELVNHAGDSNDWYNRKFLFVFTDTYMSELADTMRRMGRAPYKISHEYVVNNSRQDFTLRCVSPDKTWEYEIASGDSADIERRWLMEWTGTDGGHYEFGFRDSTLVAWPIGKKGYDLEYVSLGDNMPPRRYFNFTVSREGGGMRRYEITDSLLNEIGTEMAKARKAQPWLFQQSNAK